MKQVFAWFVASGLWVLATAGLQAEPTEEREWKSTAGTKLKAKATKVEDGKAHFQTSKGTTHMVPLEKLEEDDRNFLQKHFSTAKSVAKKLDDHEETVAPKFPLDVPKGRVIEDVPIDSKTSYHLYVPQSYKQQWLAPVIIAPYALTKYPDNMDLIRPSAELFGMIVAICSNPRKCLEHMEDTLPIDPERVIAFGSMNKSKPCMKFIEDIDHAGAVVENSFGMEVTPKGGYYVYLSDARGTRRYGVAKSRALFKRDGIVRYYTVPAWDDPPPRWIVTDSFAFVHGDWLAKNGKTLTDQCLDYENAVIDVIQKTRGYQAWRCYDLAMFLRERYEISSENKPVIDKFIEELGKDLVNVAYRTGLAEIEEQVRRYYITHGGGTQFGHTTLKIKRVFNDLAEEFQGIPHIHDVALDMAKQTYGGDDDE